MKPILRGQIWGIDRSFGVGDLDDVAGQNSLNGEPSRALNVRERGTLPSGERYAAGELAKREEDRVEVPTISTDGEIDLTHEDRVVESYSAWAVVPGEFVLVWKEWAGKHLYFNFPMDEPTDQNIWLNGLYEAHDFQSISSVGFKHRQDSAEKGTVHGNNVTSDEALGADLDGDSYLNELRYEHWWEGHMVKAYLAASGYAEVYNPSDFTTEQFLHYVRDVVYPHTESAEDDLQS